MPFDDNIRRAADGIGTECLHCGTRLGTAADDPVALALKREQPSTAAGPGIRVEARHYTDREVVLRQVFCPGCLAVLGTEVVPGDEARRRGWRSESGAG